MLLEINFVCESRKYFKVNFPEKTSLSSAYEMFFSIQTLRIFHMYTVAVA